MTTKQSYQTAHPLDGFSVTELEIMIEDIRKIWTANPDAIGSIVLMTADEMVGTLDSLEAVVRSEIRRRRAMTPTDVRYLKPSRSRLQVVETGGAT